MIYKIKDNDIIVFDKTQFNPKQTLECGQVFRFGKDKNDNYFVISKNNKATIVEKDDCYVISSNDPYYFVNYFDLNTDYNLIKAQLKKNKILSKMVDFGYGIRILRGDSEEMIYSYIISQNNNIKRIQKIIEKFCEIGEEFQDYHAFPTTKILSEKNMDFFSNLGAGYRDKYLKEACEFLSNHDLEQIKTKSTDEIFKFLTSIKGVGTKVASCILLFGFGKMEKFPVDTWIEQVYYNHFSKEKRTRSQIQQYFENEFKNFSGLAQQYLFYYEREHK